MTITYPAKVTKNERKVLDVIRRGHAERRMNTIKARASGETASTNALEWNEALIGSGLNHLEFGECIAHLVAGKLIDSAREIPDFFARLRGAKEKYYFWITPLGIRFLTEKPTNEFLDVALPPPSRNDLKPQDIDDAVRLFENSLFSKPYVKNNEVEWASNVLDDDIKTEIAAAANELEVMWTTFERMFGHRGAVKSERESLVRDPVVKRTAVRVLRAQDEQRRRMGFPPSEKPGSWMTHYNGGNVGLDPPPWKKG